MKNSWIEIPENVGEKVSINESLGLIAFTNILQDEVCEDPLVDSDTYGMIHSFCNRHVNSIKENEMHELIEKYGDDIVFLSYFEHGQCIWGIEDSLNDTPDFCWDGCRRAGVWVPNQCILDNADECIRNMSKNQGTDFDSLTDYEKKLARHSWMTKQAKIACNIYTLFCNGEVYGFNVSVYKIRKTEDGHNYDQINDYRFDNALLDESCFGFYGDDEIQSIIKEVLNVEIE